MSDAPTPSTRTSLVPDMRAFLAIANVFIFGSVVFIFLFRPLDMNDKVFGALATLLGVLTGTFKDVYNYSFGTSKSSTDQAETIAQQGAALAVSAPVAPVTTTVTTVPPPGSGTGATTVTTTQPPTAAIDPTAAAQAAVASNPVPHT